MTTLTQKHKNNSKRPNGPIKRLFAKRTHVQTKRIKEKVKNSQCKRRTSSDVNNNPTARCSLSSSNFTAICAHICAEWTREHQPADREEKREERGMPLLTPRAHTRCPFRMTLLSQGICMQSELLIRATEGVISSALESSGCKTPPLGEIVPIRTNEPVQRITDRGSEKNFQLIIIFSFRLVWTYREVQFVVLTPLKE